MKQALLSSMMILLISSVAGLASEYTKVAGWTEVNAQAVRGDAPPTPDSGSHYLDLVIDNSFGRYDGYATQTIPVISSGTTAQFYVRTYEQSYGQAYFNFSDDAGGFLEQRVNHQDPGWREDWWIYTWGTNGSIKGGGAGLRGG